MTIKAIIFNVFLMIFPFYAMGNLTMEERIRSLQHIHNSYRHDTLAKILYDLTLQNRETELRFTSEILKMGDKLDDLSYFIVLRHHARIAPTGNQALFDSCITFAYNHHLGDYISSLYILKSTFFKADAIYDSAMIYTLRARDEAIKFDNIEQQANVLHILGDLYYSTGLLTKAESYYKQVQQVKGNADVWNDWRRRIIRNNLGQIELFRGNYFGAMGFFKESRQEIGKKTITSIDSLALAYIYQMIAETYLRLNENNKAAAFTDSALAIYSDFDEKKGLYETLVLKANIALSEDFPKMASSFLEEAIRINGSDIFDKLDNFKLLLLRAKIYQLLNDTENAAKYLRQYVAAKDSLDKSLITARILQIQSENEYEFLRSEYAWIRIQRTLFILLTLAGIAVFATIVFQYSKIRQKNKRLVEITVDLTNRIKSPHFQETNSLQDTPGTHDLQPSDIKQHKLVDDFIRLVKSEELFLMHDISLQKIAEKLATNRSYLSKAINAELGQNFSCYINKLRIEDAIQLISAGKIEKFGIKSMASDVGFVSRTTFISAFRKQTGMLPSTFISNYWQIVEEKNRLFNNSDCQEDISDNSEND
jgi:YesN/AraC family two-component response regulator